MAESKGPYKAGEVWENNGDKAGEPAIDIMQKLITIVRNNVFAYKMPEIRWEAKLWTIKEWDKKLYEEQSILIWL